MNSVVIPVVRTIAVEFFKAHATLFLIVFGLCFGVMKSADHVAFATFFVSSHIFATIPILVWSIYVVMMISYNQIVIHRRQYAFLQHFMLFPSLVKWRIVTTVILTELSPVTSYLMFLIGIAVKTNNTYTLSFILFALLSLFAFASVVLYQGLNARMLESPFRSITLRIIKRIPIPYPLIILEWTIRRNTLNFLLLKLFSLALLYAISMLYRDEPYDERLLAMAIVVVFSSGFNSVVDWLNFDHQHFTFFKSLPVGWMQRLVTMMGTSFIVFLPEIIYLITRYPSHLAVWRLADLSIFALSIPLLQYSILLYKPEGRQDSIPFMLMTRLLLTMLILFKVPVMILTLSILTGCYVALRNKFFNIEL